nr:uncharacterized protein LOC109171148 [Ipomoea batatas]
MAGESQKMEAPPFYTEMRRSKFVWRSVLIFNLALGAVERVNPHMKQQMNDGRNLWRKIGGRFVTSWGRKSEELGRGNREIADP